MYYLPIFLLLFPADPSGTWQMEVRYEQDQPGKMAKYAWSSDGRVVISGLKNTKRHFELKWYHQTSGVLWMGATIMSTGVGTYEGKLYAIAFDRPPQTFLLRWNVQDQRFYLAFVPDESGWRAQRISSLQRPLNKREKQRSNY